MAPIIQDTIDRPANNENNDVTVRKFQDQIETFFFTGQTIVRPLARLSLTTKYSRALRQFSFYLILFSKAKMKKPNHRREPSMDQM